MTDKSGRPGGLSSLRDEAVPSSPKASIPDAGYIQYLEEHHHITESLIGLMSLYASPEVMGKVRPYIDALGLLHINRLLDQGVPPHHIGQRGKMFNADDILVAKAIEARQGGQQ